MGRVTFEERLESTRLRSLVREVMEVKALRSLAQIGAPGSLLHVACGDGSATRLVAKHFSPSAVAGTDRDSRKVESARRGCAELPWAFSAEDVTSLSFPDGSFDLIVDLADLHNVADWRRGVAEIHRVARPGGLFFVEELSRETFARGAGRIFRALTEHPYEAMLGAEEFREHLRATGFEILASRSRNVLGLFRYFMLVARKA